MGLHITDFIQQRMDRFGITKDQVEYIHTKYAPSFGSDSMLIYRGKLPDSRAVRIQVDADKNIRDIYIHAHTKTETKGEVSKEG